MSSSTNALNDSTVSVSTTGTTSSGKKIVTSTGGSMDKTAFLKILAAELSNLDPTQDQDSTAYVTQMAQFAGIEQMTNLNDTMTKSSYDQLLGKGVILTDTDSSGNAIAGTVEAVKTDSSGSTYLELLYEDNGSSTTGWFKADDISTVTDSSSTATSSAATTSLNTSFLAASALKGEDVVVSTTDSSGNTVKVSGTVKSVVIDNGEVKINVTKSDGTTVEYPYSSVVQAGDLSTTSTSTTSTTTTT